MQLWVNGEIRQDLSTSDMGRTCEEVLEFASWITTLQPGDVVSTGTNHVGLSPIQDGDVVDMEIEGLERLTVNVEDAWKRTWPRQDPLPDVRLRVLHQLEARARAVREHHLPQRDPQREKGGMRGYKAS